jgi:hypothetical protein
LAPLSLKDTAAAAQQQGLHPEALHCLLLQQLDKVGDELSGMTPEELLLELQALQLEAMYGRDQEGGSSTTRSKKPLGSITEQFLIDQVSQRVKCKGL